MKMTKILFICHGNICRSPMAEFIMQHLCREAGVENLFEISSAAVSTEEIGNDLYPPAKRILTAHGIPFAHRAARQITPSDWSSYDYIICADRSNIRLMDYRFGKDLLNHSHARLSLMMDWVGQQRDVSDPWYTGDFETAYQDILSSCQALLKALLPVYVFDLGGVLIRLDVKRCFQAFEQLMGEDNMRAVLGMDRNGEGVKAVSVASKQLMADFERGLIEPDDFIAQVLLYCHPGTTAEEVQDAWMSMLEDLPAERLQFVKSLREKGHRVYLLSNGNDLHFNFINCQYRLDTYFDGLFLSQKMHMAKPDPQIFKAVHSAICNPSSVIFIDDILANRLAAEKSVHWQTFDSIDSLIR